MQPGSDTYVTVLEADAYVSTFYPDSGWLSLGAPQKEQRLLLACEQLEALPFTGMKTDTDQTMMFPRYPSDTVPWSIKAAQIEIAVLPFRESTDEAARIALQRQGVTSFSLGDLSESYGGLSGLASAYSFMADAKIAGLLARYLQGGYPVC